MQIAFPFHVTRRGREAPTGRDAHIRDMIEIVLFTSPGERVNRPDFGCGLLGMTFAGNSEAVGAATQPLVMGSLQQWLGHLIQVEGVDVATEDEALHVTIRYAIKGSQERRVATFSR